MKPPKNGIIRSSPRARDAAGIPGGLSPYGIIRSRPVCERGETNDDFVKNGAGRGLHRRGHGINPYLRAEDDRRG